MAYWLLSPDDRRTVRRIETTCRAVGDRRLDAIALGRLRRAARRERFAGRLFGRHPAATPAATPTASERLARLCSTLRHPSRTGACLPGRVPGTVPAAGARTRPRTS